MTVMRDLHAQLAARKPGLGSLMEFQRACEEALAGDSGEAGVLRLLADMAARFVDRYDRVPLPSDVASAAYDKLVSLTDRAAAATRPDEKLAVINEIARSELG
jgi:hypothetical protein